MLVDLHVAGAVHGFQREGAVVLRFGDEHVLVELLPMTGRLPQGAVHQLGAVDLLIAVGLVDAAHVVDQHVVERPALGVPEDGAGRLFLEVEQVHLAAELAVVALRGLLQLMQVLLQLLRVGEGRAVDAGHHAVGGVAAPIGAGRRHQLERLADLAGGRPVRAAAQVGPLALPVDRERLAFRDQVDQLDLVGLAGRLEMGAGLLARPFLTREGPVAANDLAHLLLDRLQVVRRERLGAVEIVVEAVGDDRSDGDLRVGPDLLHGLGQHVRAIVADQLQRARVVAGDDLDCRIRLDRARQVDELAVERDRHRLLAQRLGDGFGDLDTGRAGSELPDGCVGEGQFDHSVSSSAYGRGWSCCARGITCVPEGVKASRCRKEERDRSLPARAVRSARPALRQAPRRAPSRGVQWLRRRIPSRSAGDGSRDRRSRTTSAGTGAPVRCRRAEPACAASRHPSYAASLASI